MKPANQKKLQKHLQAVAKILYQEVETKELESLAGIEKTIRAQTLEYITPELGIFFWQKQQEQQQEEQEKLRAWSENYQLARNKHKSLIAPVKDVRF